MTRPTHPVVALATAHLLRLVRMGRERLSIAAILTAFGGAGLLTLRSEPTSHPLPRALAVMAVPLVLVAAILAAPLLESERAFRPLLRSLKIHRLAVAVSFLLAIATPTSALAAQAGVAASIACQVSPTPLVGSLVGWALVLSCAVGAWARRHDRTKTRSASLFAGGVLVLALLALSVVLAW